MRKGQGRKVLKSWMSVFHYYVKQIQWWIRALKKLNKLLSGQPLWSLTFIDVIIIIGLIVEHVTINPPVPQIV